MVRAKFRVSRIERALGSQRVTKPDGSAGWETREVQTIVLNPVVSGSAENDAFYAATPSGEIRLSVVNVEAARRFELEGEYYVDFSPAE